jgi:hypothetical protein
MYIIFSHAIVIAHTHRPVRASHPGIRAQQWQWWAAQRSSSPSIFFYIYLRRAAHFAILFRRIFSQRE